MADLDPIQELGRKLVRQGVPGRYVARVVRELTEHREDLEGEARAGGQSPDAARSAAGDKLGDIDELAKELLATRRRSYWWGRHPLVSFVLLPLPMFILSFFGILWLWGEASGLFAWSEHRHTLPEPNWAAVRVGFYAVLCVAFTISVSFICYLARRCCCGLKWTLIGCGIFFVQGYFFRTGFTPPHGPEPASGNFWIGYWSTGPSLPELTAWAVPLLLFVLYCYIARRAPLIKASD
jgi:hypothetical protein